VECTLLIGIERGQPHPRLVETPRGLSPWNVFMARRDETGTPFKFS
jgi:hypothetical protein